MQNFKLDTHLNNSLQHFCLRCISDFISPLPFRNLVLSLQLAAFFLPLLWCLSVSTCLCKHPLEQLHSTLHLPAGFTVVASFSGAICRLAKGEEEDQAQQTSLEFGLDRPRTSCTVQCELHRLSTRVIWKKWSHNKCVWGGVGCRSSKKASAGKANPAKTRQVLVLGKAEINKQQLPTTMTTRAKNDKEKKEEEQKRQELWLSSFFTNQLYPRLVPHTHSNVLHLYKLDMPGPGTSDEDEDVDNDEGAARDKCNVR